MKKALSIYLSLCLCALVLIGCTADTNTNEDADATATDAQTVTIDLASLTDQTIYGYVESIADNTLTLSLGTLSTAEMSEMPNGADGTAPAMPDNSDSDASGGTAPSMPSDGTAPSMPSDGTAPSMPSDSDGTTRPDGMGGGMGGMQQFTKDGTVATLVVTDASILTSEQFGQSTAATLSDVTVGSILAITIDANSNITNIAITDARLAGDTSNDAGGQPGAGGGQADAGNQPGGMGGGSSAPTDYDSANTYSTDDTVSDTTLTSTGTDENAVLVTNAATVLFENTVLSRISSDSTGGDNASFYGVGAALLVIDGTATVSNGSITTDAAGGAGAFAFDTGVVYIAGCTIQTEQDTSGGVHVAGGGTLYGWDLTVTTNGASSAAIRSDRGGGTMVLDGGDYTSNGSGSPAIYCTADITVHNATLTANGSEAVCIEGRNTLRLFDCVLSGNMPNDSQNDTTWTVIVYQSMSGDSQVGDGVFQMVGGTLTANRGGVFYTTNTECHFLLNDVTIVKTDADGAFLQCTGNTNARGWGSAGANGSDCTFTTVAQTMQGDVIWDSISTLAFYMTEGSTLNGAFVQDETWAGDGGTGSATLYLDSSSTWIVTGDSTLTTLHNNGVIRDADGNTVTIVGTDGTVYQSGTGAYTITVTQYDTVVDLSGADSVPAYSSYAVTKPDTLA